MSEKHLCPKCGYEGHVIVYHGGTGEMECDKCRHDFTREEEKKARSRVFLNGKEIKFDTGFRKKCPKCGKKSLATFDYEDRCFECGYVLMFDPISVQKLHWNLPPMASVGSDEWYRQIGHANY